jgi:Zn-dependent metalloprotease
MAGILKGKNGGSTPDPDPTLLTTQSLEREIKGLREVLETRMDGQDKIVSLMQASLLKRRTDIESEVMHLQRLHEEKFSSIQTQFIERDTRSEQSALDSKAAVATAFQAAKEAVAAALQAAKEAVAEQNRASSSAIAKSEAATTKQIDQIGVLISAANTATNDKIDDMKQRLTSVESRKIGATESKDDSRSNAALAISAIMAMIGIGAFVYHSNAPTPTPATTASIAPQPIIIQMPSVAPAPTTVTTTTPTK